MKRGRRTYRLHEDTQLGIEALAAHWELHIGEALERAIEPELRAAFGRSWREQVRERRGPSGAVEQPGYTASQSAEEKIARSCEAERLYYIHRYGQQP